LARSLRPFQHTGTIRSIYKEGRLRFFEPEFSALLDQVVAHLEEACETSATDEARLNACLRDHFVAAFDDSRQGRRYCQFHADVSDFIGCVAVGNTLLDVRHRLSDDTPVPPGFWQEEGAMIDALTETIVKRGVDVCVQSEGEGRVQECVMDWFEQKVDLPASLAGRCRDQSGEKDRYACFVEGIMLRYLQDHVPRLGAMST
jgi:hypothetical protein